MATGKGGSNRADRTVGKRIDDLRIERGLEAKQFYGLIGWDKGEYSRKTRGLTPIFPDEAARASQILHAPKGWPYISVEEGHLLEALGGHVGEVLKSLPEIFSLLARHGGGGNNSSR